VSRNIADAFVVPCIGADIEPFRESTLDGALRRRGFVPKASTAPCFRAAATGGLDTLRREPAFPSFRHLTQCSAPGDWMGLVVPHDRRPDHASNDATAARLNPSKPFEQIFLPICRSRRLFF
jgi:hypothetical protein